MLTAAPPLFAPGPIEPALRPGEVHLWKADLRAVPEEIGDCLAAPEWVRAGRFHFARDRRRFIAGRGLLRTVLARYLEIDPREVQLTMGAHGKPALAGASSTLRFNLSHSGDLLLIALTHAREIGVDVELMRDTIPFEMLAEHYFAPEDAWHMHLLPAAEKATKFYDVWTSTEARLKASGLGLANGTKVIEPDRWSLLTLKPAEGYAAALAVEGGDFELACWSWPGCAGIALQPEDQSWPS
jgi:4'-phosphopantetheinyl transferase